MQFSDLLQCGFVPAASYNKHLRMMNGREIVALPSVRYQDGMVDDMRLAAAIDLRIHLATDHVARKLAMGAAHSFTILYKNYRDELSLRKIVPWDIQFGSNEWHPEPQYLLCAQDMEKKEDRHFALSGIIKSYPDDAAPTSIPLYLPGDKVTINSAKNEILGEGRVREILWVPGISEWRYVIEAAFRLVIESEYNLSSPLDTPLDTPPVAEPPPAPES